jgi:hypothetical protein
MDPEDREAFVHDSVTSFLCSPVLVVLYLLAVRDLGSGDVSDKFERTTSASQIGLAVHCGMTLYDYFFAFPLDSSKGAVYYMHHAVTLAVFLSVLFFRKLHFFACACALVEATNPLVGTMQQIDRAKLKEDQHAGGINWTAIYMGCGMSLLVSWVVIRLLLLPVVIRLYLHDATEYFSSPQHLAALTSALGATCIAAASFIWGLSCMWFGDMCKIFLKELGIGNGK